MTCSSHDYAYGFAGCCRCECAVDLASEPPSASFQFDNVDLYFFFCPQCIAHLRHAGGNAQQQAVFKATEKALLAMPEKTGLAFTTSIALHAHGGDLVRAYELGAPMPRPVHDAIVSGDADATFLPFSWGA